MKRLITFFIVALVTMSLSLVPVFGFSAKVHGDYVHKVLFGLDSYQLIVSEYREEIKILDSALTLCIDQFNNSDSSLLTALKDAKVNRIPDSISEMNLIANAQTHRRYTHQGWESQESYLKENGLKDFVDKWKDRKTILLSSVNKVFDFGLFAEISAYLFGMYNEKCDSFAATIYYVHILSDYLEAENYKDSIKTMMPIATRTSSGYTDIINEMIKHFEVLFSSQLEDSNYSNLIEEMKEIHRDILKVSKSDGYPFNDESYKEYHEQVNKLIDTLIKYVPKLLEKEKFFAKKFDLS